MVRAILAIRRQHGKRPSQAPCANCQGRGPESLSMLLSRRRFDRARRPSQRFRANAIEKHMVIDSVTVSNSVRSLLSPSFAKQGAVVSIVGNT